MTEPSAGLEQEETEHDVDLIHECVVKMAKEISDFMDITPDKQRMDSLMVAANIRNLSLLELFYTCVANLCKIMDERGTKIPDEQYHYIKKDDYNKCIYHKRDMDATERKDVYNQGLRNIYWLTCQLFFVIFLKFLGIKTVAFYDRKPLK